MGQRWAWGAMLSIAVVISGCGGGESGTGETHEDSASTSGSERSRSDDGVAITGLMGTIQPAQVEGALSPRMNRFTRCFATRMNEVEYLGGSIRMSFRIDVEGNVLWVYPAESDIGDRDVERCIIEAARSTHFPRPRGGEAEFSWGMGMDPPEDVREPVAWQADVLGDRAEDVHSLRSECNTRGRFRITAYIAPGGSVQTAGGAMPDSDSDAALDCVLDRVRGMTMPDPGSYAAKLAFDL